MFKSSKDDKRRFTKLIEVVMKLSVIGVNVVKIVQFFVEFLVIA